MNLEFLIPTFILIILVFFFFNWILNKQKIGKEKNRKVLAIIPTIIASRLIYLLVILLWVFSLGIVHK